MKLHEILIRRVKEQATAGATSAGNIASLANPHVAAGPDRSGTKAPKLPKIVQPKNPDGTAKGAHNLTGTSLFGGPGIKRS